MMKGKFSYVPDAILLCIVLSKRHTEEWYISRDVVSQNGGRIYDVRHSVIHKNFVKRQSRNDSFNQESYYCKILVCTRSNRPQTSKFRRNKRTSTKHISDKNEINLHVNLPKPPKKEVMIQLSSANILFQYFLIGFCCLETFVIFIQLLVRFCVQIKD